MTTLHPMPDALWTWLTVRSFQVMSLRGTRPWPNQADYWIEVSVTGAADSPITFVRATQAAAPGQRGRHTAYCGIAIEVDRNSDQAALDAAYRHFLDLNGGATGNLSGRRRYPQEKHPDGRPPPPAVK